MKITIVTGFFLPVPPVRGGSTEKIWQSLSQLFAAAGHEVTVVSRRWPGFAEQEKISGVNHLRLPGADHASSLGWNLWHDFWWGVRVALAVPPADVIICNTVTLPVWLRRFKPRAGKVVAVMARMPKGHGRAYGGVDLIFSLSEAVSAKLVAENSRLSARIVAFPYPIDWALHFQSAKKATAVAPLTIGYVGRVHPEKGLRLLLAAAVRLASRFDLPPWRVKLVGPWSVPEGGGGEEFHQQLIAEFGPRLGSRLEFVGAEFDRQKLAQHYGAMDVFCYPSLAEAGETFGVAVAEAMAAGAAPVVSGLPCFADLVQDGVTGLVFDHLAPDAEARLADALARLLADPALRRALAQRAQDQVRKYDYAESSRAVLAILSRLVHE